MSAPAGKLSQLPPDDPPLVQSATDTEGPILGPEQGRARQRPKKKQPTDDEIRAAFQKIIDADTTVSRSTKH